MERLYPNPKTFVDNSEPDLDAEYFNGVETGLSAVDERLANLLVTSLTTTVAGQKALDAVVGRILDERITANAEAIAKTNSNLTSLQKLRHETFIPNVSNSDYIDVSLKYKINANNCLVATNGDYVNYRGYIKGIYADVNTNTVRVYLSEPKNGAMRINVWYYSVE